MKPYFLYSDKQLVELLMERDKECFEHVFKRYAQSLYTFIRKGMAVKEECEVVVQEIFESLWSRRGTLAHVKLLNADLYRTASRKLIWHILDTRLSQDQVSEPGVTPGNENPSDCMLTKYLQDNLTPEERYEIEDWIDALKTADTSNLVLTDEEIDMMLGKTVARLEIQENILWRPVEEPKTIWNRWIVGVRLAFR